MGHGRDDRGGQAVAVGVGVVGEDARGGHGEGRVEARAVAVGHRDRGLVGARREDRARSGVGEGRPRDRQELPVVRRGVEGQLEDAERRVVPHFARGADRADPVVRLPTRANREDAHPVGWVRGTRGVHRRLPLVDVVVTLQHDVDMMRIHHVVEGLQFRLIRRTGAIARLVDHGDDVLRRVRVQVGRQPVDLCGSDAAPARNKRALGVQCDDVPVAAGDVVAVVAIPARRGSVVGEVAREIPRRPVVVPGHRPCPRLDRAPPRGVIAVVEVDEGAIGIDVVADREDLAGDAGDGGGRTLIAWVAALGDVARTHEDRIR